MSLPSVPLCLSLSLCLSVCLSRCSRLYDRLLLRQERWSHRYAPAVEHACALTVVNANPSITDNSHVNQLPRRKRILNIIASVDAEEQLAKLQQLSVQGRWLEWTDVMNSDLSWRRLLHGLDDSELSFSLRVITNTLPTPDNLRRWGQLTTDTSCPLCGRKATLRHILNGCSVALRQGRYTWRHDNVLRILKRHFLKFWECLQRESTNSTKDAPFIHLVPEGLPQLPVRQRQRRPLLSTDTLRCASDWQFCLMLMADITFFRLRLRRPHNVQTLPFTPFPCEKFFSSS